MKYHAAQKLPLAGLRCGDLVRVGGTVCEVWRVEVGGLVEVSLRSPDLGVVITAETRRVASFEATRPPMSPQEQLARRLWQEGGPGGRRWDAASESERASYRRMAAAALAWTGGR